MLLKNDFLTVSDVDTLSGMVNPATKQVVIPSVTGIISSLPYLIKTSNQAFQG